MARKPLAEAVATPEFAAAVDRQRAKLDAEDAGWVVMEPKRARAMEAVVRAAKRLIVRHRNYFIVRDGIQYTQPLRDALDRAERLIVRHRGYFVVRDGIRYAKPLRDALDRLARLSSPSTRRGKGGTG